MNKKILWSGFCGMLLCIPIFSSAQTDKIPVAKPAVFNSATGKVPPTDKPMLLKSEEAEAVPTKDPITLEDMDTTPEPTLPEEEAGKTPAMGIEVLDNGIEVSNKAPAQPLYNKMTKKGLDKEAMMKNLPVNKNTEINYQPSFDKDPMAPLFYGIGMTLLFLLFLGIPALSIILIIKAARKNWDTKKKKEKSVGYAGFWKRLAIKAFDKMINLTIVPIFFSLYYYFRDGQTIGDKVFGGKIVDKKSHEMASVGKLLMRFIAKIVSCVALGVGFWPAGWRKEKNAWHDSLSDTRYISTKKTHGAWIVLTIIFGILLPLLIIVPTVTGMILMAQMGAI